MCHYIPTRKDSTTIATWQLLLKEVFKHHGFPLSIISDRDRRLRDQWKEFCNTHGIVHKPTTAFHPQGNGQAERSVQTLKQQLRLRALDREMFQWDQELPLLEMLYNNAPTTNGKHSPYYLNYGFHPTIGDSIRVVPEDEPEVETPNEFRQRHMRCPCRGVVLTRLRRRGPSST